MTEQRHYCHWLMALFFVMDLTFIWPEISNSELPHTDADSLFLLLPCLPFLIPQYAKKLL